MTPGATPRVGGDVERLAVRRAEHERTAVRVHVVADEREQSFGELPRVVRRRVERQHAIDQIDGARLLPERFAAPMQLDVRLLELLDRRRRPSRRPRRRD